MFASLVNAKIKEAAELEQMKKDHLKEVRKGIEMRKWSYNRYRGGTNEEWG